MRVVIAIAFVCAALPMAVWADDLDERMRVAPGGLLEVDVDLGDGLRPDPGSLEVESHDLDEVHVIAVATGWGASGVKFDLTREGDSVRLFGRVDGAVAWLFGGPNITVRIWVPREFSLDLHTTAGPIRIEDARGRIRAHTAAASIETERTEGPLKLRTSGGNVIVSEAVGEVDVKITDGDIEISRVTGNVEARTSDGGIEIDHVRGRVDARNDWGSIEVRAVDGDILAKTERGSVFASFDGPLAGHLETSRGGVEVVIPERAGAELDAVSRSGSVTLAAGIEVPGEHTEMHVAGPINGGGRPLTLYTARGDVRVRKR